MPRCTTAHHAMSDHVTPSNTLLRHVTPLHIKHCYALHGGAHALDYQHCPRALRENSIIHCAGNITMCESVFEVLIFMLLS